MPKIDSGTICRTIFGKMSFTFKQFGFQQIVFRQIVPYPVFAPAKRLRWGRNVSSPAIWATKISAHFGDNNVAQMSRRLNGQICSHTPSALNAGAKRSGTTCHMAMPQCCYLAKGAMRPSHTTNMLTSSNISIN